MKSIFLLMAKFDDVVLDLKQVCGIMRIEPETAYVMRSNGTFPIKMYGKPLRANVDEVAKYMDDMQKSAT